MGIDPGTTVAFAAIDLNGSLVAVGSGRSLSRRDVVERVSRLGSPVLFACDVHPAPEAVVKIAAAFNANIFSAEKDLRVQAKKELARGFRVSNEHEMDALASALKAFKSLENKFRQIDIALAEAGLSHKSEEAKELVMNGTRIDHMLLMLKEWQLPEIKIKERTPQERQAGESRLRKDLVELLRANAELSKRVHLLENELSLLKEELSRVRGTAFSQAVRDRELLKRDAEIRRLRAALHSRRKEARLKTLDGQTPLDIQGIVSEYREKR